VAELPRKNRKAPHTSDGAFLEATHESVDEDYLMPLELDGYAGCVTGNRLLDSHHRAMACNLHSAFDKRKQEVDRDGRVYLRAETAIKEGAGKTDVTYQRGEVLPARIGTDDFSGNRHLYAQRRATLIQRTAHYVYSHLALKHFSLPSGAHCNRCRRRAKR